MSKAKYERGSVITTIEELSKQENIYFGKKIINKGFFQNWSLRYCLWQLAWGHLYKAEIKELSLKKR